MLVLLNFGCGYLGRISNTKLNMNIWRRKSSNSNQFYTLNKAFLSQHTPYRCTWKYGFDNMDSQYLWLLPTRGRYFMMLANGARGALFWRASHLGNKMILQPAAYASNLPSSQTEAILTVGWCKHFTLWVPAISLYRVFGSGRHLFCPT